MLLKGLLLHVGLVDVSFVVVESLWQPPFGLVAKPGGCAWTVDLQEEGRTGKCRDNTHRT